MKVENFSADPKLVPHPLCHTQCTVGGHKLTHGNKAAPSLEGGTKQAIIEIISIKYFLVTNAFKHQMKVQANVLLGYEIILIGYNLKCQNKTHLNS